MANRVNALWRTADGLPQNSVKAIVQSSEGYIWVATEDGLGRFDGVHMTTYNVSNTPQLAMDNPNQLLEDRYGALWIAGDGGLTVLRNGTFRNCTAEITHAAQGLTCRLSPDGVFWANQGGHFYCAENGSLQPVCDLSRFSGLKAWAPSNDGSIVIGGLFGCVRYAAGDVKPVVLPGAVDLDVNSLDVDGSGAIWLTSSHGVDVVRGTSCTHVMDVKAAGANATVVADRRGNVWLLCNGRLYSIANDRPQLAEDWVGTPIGNISLNSSGDLVCWYGRKISDYQTYSSVALSVNRSFASVDDSAHLSGPPLCALRDRQDNVWIGTDNGLHCFRDRNCHTYGSSDGLPASRITAAFVGLAGQIYVGEENGVVYGLKGATDRLFMPVATSSSPVYSLTETSDGDILCLSGGSIKILENGRLVDSGTRYDVAKAGRISTIASTQDGDTWFTGNQGIVQYNGDQRQFYSLPHPNLSFIVSYADRQDRLWASTTDALYCLDNGKLHTYTAADGLASQAVSAIYQDDDGTLWFGHNGGGLTRYKDGRFVHVGRRNGLPSANVYQLAGDDRQDLWIGGTRDLYRVKLDNLNSFIDGKTADLHCYSYGAADGNYGGQCISGIQLAALKGWDGSLWFPSLFGLVRVDPEDTDTDSVPVLIQDARFDGRLFDPNTSAIAPPGQGNVTLSFTALDLKDAEHLIFQYKLDGYDHDWIDADAGRTANYTNLPPGRYQFQLRCLNVDGGWQSATHFDFELRPHYYQTWWFRALVVIWIVLTAFGLTRARIRGLRQRNAVLQEMQERLEEQNKELLAGREELESQNQELISLKVELEAQNEELVLSHETLEDLNLRLHALAATDGLTGLMNHRTFQEEIRREWSSSLPGSLSLLLLDVDHFKSYNDTYGHQCGDEILITLGQTLQSLARDGDIVARYGGEEFAAILHGADAAAAAHAAERFRSAIELHDWPRRPITASIGVATLSADMTGPQDLIRAADNALYYSKEQGRNRVSCASDLNDHKVIAA